MEKLNDEKETQDSISGKEEDFLPYSFLNCCGGGFVLRTKKPLTGLTEGEDGGEESHLNSALQGLPH